MFKFAGGIKVRKSFYVTRLRQQTTRVFSPQERARPVGFKCVINLDFAKHLPKLTRAVKYSIGDRTSLENMTSEKYKVGSL